MSVIKYKFKNSPYTEYRNEQGELHRIGGPAIIDKNIIKQYWINGILYDGARSYWQELLNLKLITPEQAFEHLL